MHRGILCACLCACLCVCLLAAAHSRAVAQDNPFLGKWDISGVAPNANYVYWLEVKKEGDHLKADFLNRSGSVLPVASIKIEGDELVFTPAGQRAATHRARVEDGRLLGQVKAGENEIAWIGVRPPQWSTYDANKRHTMGTPVVLFDGKVMDNWEPQIKDKPLGWTVVDGVMTNEPHANNLISKHRFENFKIRCEYKVGDKSNSGIYLRGRYELQVLDDFGKEPEIHGHMALYSRVKPLVNASLPKGEWQWMEATIIGNRLTVVLNGKKVQDNIVIDGITGGALDSREGEPGPILIQGDHEKIWYRKVVVTPILK